MSTNHLERVEISKNSSSYKYTKSTLKPPSSERRREITLTARPTDSLVFRRVDAIARARRALSGSQENPDEESGDVEGDEDEGEDVNARVFAVVFDDERCDRFQRERARGGSVRKNSRAATSRRGRGDAVGDGARAVAIHPSIAPSSHPNIHRGAAGETAGMGVVSRHRSTRAQAVNGMRDNGLPRSDSAMTLRNAQKGSETSARATRGKSPSRAAGDRGDPCVTDANRVAATPATRGDGTETPLGGEDEDEDMLGEETPSARELVPDRRWYTLVKIHDDGCTVAVSDAELAMLEASILKENVGGGANAWTRPSSMRPCSSEEDGSGGRWAPDDAEEYEECGASGRGGDSMSAWEDSEVSRLPSAAPGVAGHTKPGGPCDHCGALDSPQWRRGPASKPMLCNACGTRYRRTNNLGPSPSSRMATPEKRKATAVQQNDTPRGKKNARCGAIGEKFSRANAMVY